MKTILVREIGQALRAMGFRVDISGDADIFVSEILKAKGNGNISMQLELTVAVALDTKHKSILYFEKIVDPAKMGASAGVGRYITRVQQTTLGNIEEVTFDLGQIKEQVRAVALKYGLRFRTVASLKAIYKRSRQTEQEDQVLYEAPTFAQSRGDVEAALKHSAASQMREPRAPRISSGMFSVWVLALLLAMMVAFGIILPR